jgi:hypothetical protein
VLIGTKFAEIASDEALALGSKTGVISKRRTACVVTSKTFVEKLSNGK